MRSRTGLLLGALILAACNVGSWEQIDVQQINNLGHVVKTWQYVNIREVTDSRVVFISATGERVILSTPHIVTYQVSHNK